MTDGGALAGKVAIITGAARGQGAAEAQRFVEEGAQVLVTDVRDELGRSLVATLGPAAHYHHLDVRSEDDWRTVVAAADALGPLQVLVNNAAIHWLKPLAEETLGGLQEMLAVNVGGPLVGMNAVRPSMAAAGGGSIVNVSSTAGLTGYPSHGAYGASKWALRGLTKTAALELAVDRIRVNSLHPGAVESPMAGDTSAPGRWDRVPLTRAADPAEVAALVLFLASDASAYVTGTELTIDGGATAGIHAVPQRRPEPP